MSLAEQLHDDVRGVFLRQDDFARPVIWDGREILAVEDADRLREMQSKRDDLREATRLLYIAQDDLKNAPVPGGYVTADGRRYKIVSADTEEGMYVVTMEEIRR